MSEEEGIDLVLSGHTHGVKFALGNLDRMKKGELAKSKVLSF